MKKQQRVLIVIARDKTITLQLKKLYL